MAEDPKTLAPMAEDPKTSLAPMVEDPKTTLAPMVEGPETSLALMTEDPKTSLAPMVEKPKTSLVSLAEDPKTSLAPMGEDLKTLAPMVEDPKTSIAPMVEDPKTSLAPMVEDPKTSLVPLAEDPKTSLAPMAEDPKTLAPMGENPKTSLAPMAEDPKTSLSSMVEDPETSLAPMVDPETSLAPMVDPETSLAPMVEDPKTLSSMVEDPKTSLSSLVEDPETLAPMVEDPDSDMALVANVDPKTILVTTDHEIPDILADVYLTEVDKHVATDLTSILENSCDSCGSDVFPYYGSVLDGHAELAQHEAKDANETVTRQNRFRSVRNHQKTKYPRVSSDTEEEEMDISDDDEDYEPKSVESNSTDSGSGDEMKMRAVKKTCRKVKSVLNQVQMGENLVEDGDPTKSMSTDDTVPVVQSSSFESRSLKSKNCTDNSAQKSESVTVMTSKNSKEKRVWDKKQCCVYCMKFYAKLPRHLEQVHLNEIEVAEAFALSKKSEQRRQKLDLIRKKGNFAHNTNVLQTSCGELVPCRRPSSVSKPSDFLPCEDCLGLYFKSDLWKHKKNCPGKKISADRTGRPRRGSHQASSAALLPVSSEAQKQMRTLILDTMANDEIAMIARNDDLIVRFGMKLFAKNGQERHQHQYIKQKMREITRFLKAMRLRCPQVTTLSDCINPVLFQDALEAAKEISKYNAETGTYGIPSLALKLGHSIKKCCKYLKSVALQQQNEPLKTRAEQYRELMENEWSCEISSQALASLYKSTFNKPLRLPLAEDLRKLNSFLSSRAGDLVDSVENLSESQWHQLAQITLAQVVLFNRRRGGESERLLLSQYTSGIKQGEERLLQEDVAASLSPFEKDLAKSLSRVEVRGKRGRKVPILLTKTYKKQIDLLNENRSVCGISDSNDYLFARSGEAKTPHRTSDVLKKFTEQCGAQQPELITSTLLRKHVATVSQVLNLKENEMDILAGFMGHDIRVHREFYRLPEDTLQVAKVSKILLELERGNISRYKGMSLDDIQMEASEVISDQEMDEVSEKDKMLFKSSTTPELESDGNSGPTQRKRKRTSRDNTENEPVSPPTQIKKHSGDRTSWTNGEKAAVTRQLDKFLRLLTVPGKRHCEEAIKNERVLQNRNWKQIKYCVKNMISTKKRKAMLS